MLVGPRTMLRWALESCQTPNNPWNRGMESGSGIDKKNCVGVVWCNITDSLQVSPPLPPILRGCPTMRAVGADRYKLQYSIFAVNNKNPRVTVQNYKISLGEKVRLTSAITGKRYVQGKPKFRSKVSLGISSGAEANMGITYNHS